MALAKDSTLKAGTLRGLASGLTLRRLSGVLTNRNGATGGTSIGPEGPAGTGNYQTLSIPSSHKFCNCSYVDRVSGRVIGLLTSRDTTIPPFDVVVDGQAFRIDNPRALWNNFLLSGMADGYGAIVLPEIFDDGYHTVEVHLASDPGGAATTLKLYAWIAEQNAGYQVQQRAAQPAPSTTTLTTSPQIMSGFGHLTSAISFVNYDLTATHEAYLSRVSSSGTIWKTVRMAPGEDGEIRFPVPFDLPGVYWWADANSAVHAWIEGA